MLTLTLTNARRIRGLYLHSARTEYTDCVTITHARWVPLHGALIALASLTTLSFLIAKGLGL
jgi:hypothetical protein